MVSSLFNFISLLLVVCQIIYSIQDVDPSVNPELNDLVQSSIKTIGCEFENVCEEGEVCIDDGMFGTCSNAADASSTPNYKLDRKASKLLESEMSKLVIAGYSWEDDFTQCVVKNVLLSDRFSLPYHPSFCYPIVSSENKDVEKRVSYGVKRVSADPTDIDAQQVYKSMKKDLKKRTLVDAMNQFDEMQDDAAKKKKKSSDFDDSEEVQLHKYFADEPKPEEEEDEAEIRGELPAEDELGLREEENSVSLNRIRQELLKDIGAEDTFEAEKPVADETQEEEISDDEMLPEDKLMLEELIAGRVQPSDLSTRLLKRLDGEVENLVEELKAEQEADNQVEQNREEELDEEAEPVEDVEAEAVMEKRPNLTPPSAEQMEVNGYSNAGKAKSTVKVQTPSMQGTKLVAESKGAAGDSGPAVEKRIVVSRRNYVDKRWIWVEFADTAAVKKNGTTKFLSWLSALMKLPNLPSFLWRNDFLYVKLQPEMPVNGTVITPKQVAEKLDSKQYQPADALLQIRRTGLGKPSSDGQAALPITYEHSTRWTATLVVCAVLLAVICAVVCLFLVQKFRKSKKKVEELNKAELGASGGVPQASDYQDLCRQRMQAKGSEKTEPLSAAATAAKLVGAGGPTSPDSNPRSSTSSWSEEPVQTNMDITTGHLILSYMEEHLQDKDKLASEWQTLCAYEADRSAADAAKKDESKSKNRYVDILPYDHSRVKLDGDKNAAKSDYINASLICDREPKNPSYIIAQGPLANTVADFWQMVWEQGALVIVNLTRNQENGVSLCHRYWPDEGAELYHDFEVHLVSEHVWCEDYLVRSFYLKNVRSGETRTVTQFHFRTWNDQQVPKVKSALDFRRKVNKSFRGKTNPIIVHCSDGCGRSGTYVLMDAVLNRIAKGVKEIDIAATLEHLRDQRCDLVKNKDQFEFVLTAVAEEVHAVLKSMPQ